MSGNSTSSARRAEQTTVVPGVRFWHAPNELYSSVRVFDCIGLAANPENHMRIDENCAKFQEIFEKNREKRPFSDLAHPRVRPWYASGSFGHVSFTLPTLLYAVCSNLVGCYHPRHNFCPVLSHLGHSVCFCLSLLLTSCQVFSLLKTI